MFNKKLEIKFLQKFAIYNTKSKELRIFFIDSLGPKHFVIDMIIFVLPDIKCFTVLYIFTNPATIMYLTLLMFSK